MAVGEVFQVADYAAGRLPMQVIAHRGFSGKYPENSLLAFDKAIDVGADLVEFDVRLTADDHLVVFHDPTLAKFTLAAVPIHETKLADLQSIDLGLGQRVPTLEQAVKHCAGRVGMNIHIKGRGGVCERVIECCRDADVLRHVFFAVEWGEDIRRLRRTHPEAWVCSLFERGSKDMVALNADLDVKILQPSVEAVLRGGKLMVEQAQARGMVMGVFYADAFSHLRWMKKLRVAGVLTNFPDSTRACLGRTQGTDDA